APEELGRVAWGGQPQEQAIKDREPQRGGAIPSALPGPDLVANTYTNLLYHIVFSTKNRKPLIREDDKETLYAYIGGIVRGERGGPMPAGRVPSCRPRPSGRGRPVEPWAGGFLGVAQSPAGLC
ncbi:MAG: hypothetical protein V3T83_03160, partial [Acidobacteriota bacterium]